MKAIARAKINLLLRVVQTRPDGYHEIESVMQSIELADQLTFSASSADAVEFRASDPGDDFVAPEPPDLVQTALSAARSRLGQLKPQRVDVSKAIPVGAGLGGGSADAAATLLMADELTGRGMTAPEIMSLASQIGADVPFALQGGTAEARGIGEKVSALACPMTMWWVIGLGHQPLITADVYRKFDQVGSPSGRMSEQRWGKLVHALRTEDLPAVAEHMTNDLEPAAFSLMPALSEAKQALLDAGAIGAVMCGSGSAVGGLFGSEQDAKAAAGRVGGAFRQVVVTRSATRGAEIL